MASVVSNTNALAMSFKARCNCGKVEVVVHTLEKSPPLRLVCYCKDCRGYYETLNRIATDNKADSRFPETLLDSWGGVDWTCLYPRDITVVKGQNLLTAVKIRESSPIRQVYSTCCYTPFFRFGSMSVLMNSQIMNPDESSVDLPVTFRIIGRDSWKKGIDSDQSRPAMSYSVPFKWFWTMPFRIRRAHMEPMPLDLPDAKDCKMMEDFVEGSSSF